MSKTIIIDAGHGGIDSGAVGFNKKEKDWTLTISRYQYKRLTELGAKVALTRNADTTLSPTQRIAKIKNQYDICISNHWNAFDGNGRGIETIHSVKAKPDFANDLANRLKQTTNLPLRRVFHRTTSPGVDYYFLHRLTGRTETVIIEYGFIDHAQDHAYYNDEANIYKAAEAVLEGICKNLGIHYVHSTNQTVSKKDGLSGRVESIHHGHLRFYKRPSWKDEDVFGYLTFGQGFTKVLEKVKVGSGKQYKVANARGEVFYVTASPTYVKLIH
ncbi:N-acetylmuramoyl-L-alanine amidase family protein [Marinilactibacillus kalidii]|uniref:N-acetylmuramoyl-L-alanine amidase family protein n=1 Tax=Marinilactibacillus kalidii TaxID=2820274 RepID=UPI001ABECEF3|nr:N-acetylmuramoyl-L-alanine amidase [Marinilactibacillus kalidii]